MKLKGDLKSPLLFKVHGKIFAANEYSKDLQVQKIKDAISIAQGRQKAVANKHRKPLTLNENDWVLLKFPKARPRQMMGKEGHQRYYAS